MLFFRESILVNLGAVVNDGIWHTVIVKNEGQSLSILLDGCPTLDKGCFAQVDLDATFDISSSDLTVGGIQGIDILHEGKVGFGHSGVNVCYKKFIKLEHVVNAAKLSLLNNVDSSSLNVATWGIFG